MIGIKVLAEQWQTRIKYALTLNPEIIKIDSDGQMNPVIPQLLEPLLNGSSDLPRQ